MNFNWEKVKEYHDILYFKQGGIAKIVINRPHKRNAFRPQTVFELYDAFCDAREDQKVGVILLTGAGPHTDGKYAFLLWGRSKCAGVRQDMWVMMGCLVLMFWICNG